MTKGFCLLGLHRQLNSENHTFASFDLYNSGPNMIACTDLTTKFRRPLCYIPFQTPCRDDGRSPKRNDSNVLRK